MAKLNWNKFIDTHPKGAAFAAAVSATVPKVPEFDTNDRELPTPHGLFCDWCTAYLSGDWATTEINGGFLLYVATEEDAKSIRDEFKVVGQAKRTPAGKETYSIAYRDSQYAALAGDLGYVM